MILAVGFAGQASVLMGSQESVVFQAASEGLGGLPGTEHPFARANVLLKLGRLTDVGRRRWLRANADS